MSAGLHLNADRKPRHPILPAEKNTKGVGSMTPKSYKMDDATLERIELIEAARERRIGRRTLDTTATQVIRDAIEILFRFEVCGETIASPTDPRLN